ncbi:hypothetical protein PsAD2_01464 [Pseudovibrio axinellae]|uniref:Uncharacterized protein n=1 Tax=Pseudovibrio axinellae TaxID=989403 RepID=A0A165ZZ42_9HYPH|nr:hypothetical protein [Pseudovibrio axinellae]KZL20421.1 hypothetical protein PsAD2_01464 [Pseudovibrio axinellae]SER77578.1 hypothetical protein SAMN05421798_12216 [Pseudovibrio axinellae]
MTRDENTLETTMDNAQFLSDLDRERDKDKGQLKQRSSNLAELDRLSRKGQEKAGDQQGDLQTFGTADLIQELELRATELVHLKRSAKANQGLKEFDQLWKERKLKTEREKHEAQIKAQDGLLKDLIAQVETLKGQYSLLEDLKVSLDQIGTTDLTHLAKDVEEIRTAVWQVKDGLIQDNRQQFFSWCNNASEELREAKAALKSRAVRSVRTRDRLMGAALIVMAPVMFFLAIQTFVGSDTDSTVPRLSGLSSRIEYIAREQGVSLPQAVQITPPAPPVFIAPPVIIERETSRLAAPEAIFRKEALASETVATPLNPDEQARSELDVDGEAN